MVSLIIANSACGATLINDRYVLSAGHCFEDEPDISKISVIIGAYSYEERLGREGHFEKLEPQSYKVHESYYSKDEPKYANDIALIKLKNPLSYNETFSPICLPDFTDYDNLFATGWGMQNEGLFIFQKLKPPETLREVEVDEVSSGTCRLSFNIKNEKQICSGSSAGVCNGDSGGPLATRKDGHVYQVGITSYGRNGCGTKSLIMRPDIYTRVTGHLDWIKQNTQDANWCSAPKTPNFTKN